MSGWLVDTDVISALAPGRQRSLNVAEWLENHSESLYLSSVTIVEVEAGIGKLRRAGAESKGARYGAWLQAIIEHYSDRILPLDVVIARCAGELTALAQERGAYPGFADTAVAATARSHELTILTRNSKHFGVFDVPHLNPFIELPGG